MGLFPTHEVHHQWRTRFRRSGEGTHVQGGLPRPFREQSAVMATLLGKVISTKLAVNTCLASTHVYKYTPIQMRSKACQGMLQRESGLTCLRIPTYAEIKKMLSTERGILSVCAGWLTCPFCVKATRVMVGIRCGGCGLSLARKRQTKLTRTGLKLKGGGRCFSFMCFCLV